MAGVTCIGLLVLSLGAMLPGLVAAQGAEGQRAGEVTALLAVARIERGSAAAVEVQLGDAVFWQDWFETEAHGRARLGLLGGSVLNIGSGARLQVIEHDQGSERTELELQFGKVRAMVKKLSQPGARFRLRTKTAVVGVMGSHVYLHAAGERSTVINFEDRVRVRNVDGSVRGEVILEPFELAEIERGRPPRKRLARLEEMVQALEDTLPGPAIRLPAPPVRPGSCVFTISGEAIVDPDGDGTLAGFPFLKIIAHPCTGPGITPLWVCVPETAQPGVYEYVVPVADGSQRWGAFVVQPPVPLQDAWLLTSSELPPGATHSGRLVGRDNQALAGVPVRVRQGGKEKVIHTDENGGFTLVAPERGTLGLEVERAPASNLIRPPWEAPKAIKVRITVVARWEVDDRLPEYAQRGSLVNVPGEVRSARLGGAELPLLRTVTRAGLTTSSFPIPRDAPVGDTRLELEDGAGKRRTHPLVVYEVLRGWLDQRSLISGDKTPGEFVVCVGEYGGKRRKVRAHILAEGPVRFRGKGGRGNEFERTLAAEPNGFLLIPFEIRAQKRGGGRFPFRLALSLSRG